MRASVVVPTHRGAHRLPQLLDAMSAQDFDGEWELVIVVDGVVDDSLAILEAEDRVPLRLIVHPESQGVVAALNDAFAKALGDVLIRCDDDLTPAPDYVRLHVAHHEGRTDVGVIGPTRDVFPDTPYARAYGRAATERSLAAAYARPADLAWIGWAANNSIRREAWAKSGGFDPRFVYGQDSELGYRLVHDCGVTIVVDRALQVNHRGPSTSATTRIPRAFVSGASKRLFNEVHRQATPPATPANGFVDRVWRAMVAMLSRMLVTKAGYEKLGRLIDHVLKVVPTAVGARLVALGVESAGASGMRNGADDLATYKGQKQVEIASELKIGPTQRRSSD